MSYTELTEEQEKVSSDLVGAIYQENNNLSSYIEQIHRLSLELKTEIFSSVLDAVSFHQREREDYISITLLGRKIEDSSDRKNFIWALANNPSDPQGAINKTGNNISANSIAPITDPEVLNQLEIYKTVENNLIQLKKLLVIMYNIEPILPLIQNLSPEKITELLAGVESYINYAIGLKEGSLYTNISLPTKLQEMLSKISPSLPIFNSESTIEKVNYLKILQIICRSIIEGGQNVSGEEVKDVAGKIMALTNCEILYR